jgi:hypothetical protein
VCHRSIGVRQTTLARAVRSFFSLVKSGLRPPPLVAGRSGPRCAAAGRPGGGAQQRPDDRERKFRPTEPPCNLSLLLWCALASLLGGPSFSRSIAPIKTVDTCRALVESNATELAAWRSRPGRGEAGRVVCPGRWDGERRSSRRKVVRPCWAAGAAPCPDCSSSATASTPGIAGGGVSRSGWAHRGNRWQMPGRVVAQVISLRRDL